VTRDAEGEEHMCECAPHPPRAFVRPLCIGALSTPLRADLHHKCIILSTLLLLPSAGGELRVRVSVTSGDLCGRAREGDRRSGSKASTRTDGDVTPHRMTCGAAT
jgi:hypothetical protein